MGSSESTFTPAAAAAHIDAVSSLVDADRARFQTSAVPLALFGVISLVAAGVGAAWSPQTYGMFWAFAGPTGGILIGLWSWWTEVRWPFRRPHPIAMIATAVTLVIVAWLAGTRGDAALPFLVVGAAYVLFGSLTASRPTTLAAVAILAAAAAGLAGVPGFDDLVVLTATVGLIQLVAAAAELRIGRRQAASARAGAGR